MPLDTQMTLALLQELLLSLRANDPDCFKGWLAEGVHELGEPAVIELMLDGPQKRRRIAPRSRIKAWRHCWWRKRRRRTLLKFCLYRRHVSNSGAFVVPLAKDYAFLP